MLRVVLFMRLAIVLIPVMFLFFLYMLLSSLSTICARVAESIDKVGSKIMEWAIGWY